MPNKPVQQRITCFSGTERLEAIPPREPPSTSSIQTGGPVAGPKFATLLGGSLDLFIDTQSLRTR